MKKKKNPEDFAGGVSSKEPACQCRRLGFDPLQGRSPGGGHGNPLQYSCLENPMDRGAWWATVHGVSKSRTLLNDLAHKNAKTTALTGRH